LIAGSHSNRSAAQSRMLPGYSLDGIFRIFRHGDE
jgi:hypothetical protein